MKEFPCPTTSLLWVHSSPRPSSSATGFLELLKMFQVLLWASSFSLVLSSIECNLSGSTMQDHLSGRVPPCFHRTLSASLTHPDHWTVLPGLCPSDWYSGNSSHLDEDPDLDPV
ncbi:hypothetical protein AMECASPLE_036337 [Ameca splendens]|uniref:Uncharacterized protein n=1 Tax=Ameca splendens TaxID=208324 RepID=A0ABV0ZGE1_9TELE